jgi:hypothetical protein
MFGSAIGSSPEYLSIASRNLDDGFRGNGAGAGAAFLVEKVEDFAQSVGVGGIPEKGAIAANVDEAHLFELLEVMGKRGSGNAKLFLDFASNHSGGMRCKKETKDLQARLGAECGKEVSGAGDEDGVRLGHTSIFAEIPNHVKDSFASTLDWHSASYL